MQLSMVINSPRVELDRAKAAATNLGINVLTRDVRIVMANKYEKPHVGKKQILKNLRSAGKDKLP